MLLRATLGWVIAVSAATAACTTYQDDLARSQRAFDASEHERALAILRVLEPDTARLSTSDRARYAYLRGMTDYRIGYKIDARHWLGVAAAIEQATPQSLPPDSATRMTDALKELNEVVFNSGAESLTNDIGGPGQAKHVSDEEAESHGDKGPDAPVKPAQSDSDAGSTETAPH